MGRSKLVSIFLLTFFGLPFTLSRNFLFGSPGPVQLNIRSLTDKAHTVCKGRVLEIMDEGEIVQQTSYRSVPLKKMVSRFQVDRFFKGAADARILEIEFFALAPPYAGVSGNGYLAADLFVGPGLRANEYALVFLNPSRPRYTFSDPYSKLPITERPVRVSKENLNTFELLEEELLASLTDERREVIFTAIEQLGHLPKVKSTEPLKELLKIHDKELEGRVYSSLIKLGDYSLFQETLEFIETNKDVQRLRPLPGLIKLSIQGIREETMLPQLYQLTGSEDEFLRRGAIYAIRAMKSPKGVKYLMEGLDHRDIEVRYHCVMGLAEMERKGPGWGAARAFYDKDEPLYLSRWKSWWEESGKNKYSVK